MACVDDQVEIEEGPSQSPLISRYLILTWTTMVEWDIDAKMSNFQVVEFKLEKKIVKMVPRVDGMKLSKFDNFIVENLLQQGCRVWYKNITDLEDIDTHEGCLMRGQRGYLCIQLSNKMVEHKAISYLSHQRYTVRIKKEYPW